MRTLAWGGPGKNPELLFEKTFPEETQHTCLLTPEREPTIRTEPTKAWLGEPMSFIGVIYRNMGERLLWGWK